MVFRTLRGIETKRNVAEIFEILLYENNVFQAIVFTAIPFRTDTS